MNRTLITSCAGLLGNHLTRYLLDAGHDIFGFEYNTDHHQLIVEMFEWAIKQPKQEVKQFEYEIEKNMYSYWKK